jgi:hypothetical protein
VKAGAYHFDGMNSLVPPEYFENLTLIPIVPTPDDVQYLVATIGNHPRGYQNLVMRKNMGADS